MRVNAILKHGRSQVLIGGGGLNKAILNLSIDIFLYGT